MHRINKCFADQDRVIKLHHDGDTLPKMTKIISTATASAAVAINITTAISAYNELGKVRSFAACSGDCHHHDHQLVV